MKLLIVFPAAGEHALRAAEDGYWDHLLYGMLRATSGGVTNERERTQAARMR